MADRYAATEKLEAEQELMQLVGFTIGKELFGVDILMVQEIIRAAPITPVPNSPEFVEGVINLRGNILPVIDLRKRLSLLSSESDHDDTWILILDIQNKTTGFIVDSVTEVIKIQENTIEAPPDIIKAGLESQYLRGVCDIGAQLLILLDFKRILLQEEFKKLKSMDEAEGDE
ncbi:MAG: chemotaxis protein CheW [Desulfurivibrionaceae bacterium]